MSKLQQDKAQSSSIQIKSLSDYNDVLKVFLELLTSLRGPHGRTSMIQNTSGGHLTLTSSSRSLFSSLSIRRAIIKLVVSACQSHLSTFEDGGLFLAGLATNLIIEGLYTDMNLVLLSDIMEVYLTILLEFLNSSSCWLKIKAYIGDLSFIKSFVNTILMSKPLCQMNTKSLKHISHLIIECFLTSINNANMSNPECVFIQCEEGFEVLESFTKEGILVQAPEMSRFEEKNLDLKSCKHQGNDMVKVAMVTVSMSGDMEELSSVKYSVDDAVDFDGAVLDRLVQFCEVLIGQHVGLVLCQKVIHPELKYRLRENGLIVIDRTGIQPVGFIQSLTGACPLQCLDVSPNIQSMFGWVDYVSHTIIHGKSYLHLKKEGSDVTTLYLSHLQEENLKELKDVCSTALVSLRHLLYEPYVLPGAGCWQAILASHLDKQVKKTTKVLCKDLGCTEIVLKETRDLFIKCLIQAGTSKERKYLISSLTGHLYQTDETGDGLQDNHCCCKLEARVPTDVLEELVRYQTGGYLISYITNAEPREITKAVLLKKVETRELIMDSFVMCKSALQTGVLTAVSALRIGQVIEDVS